MQSRCLALFTCDICCDVIGWNVVENEITVSSAPGVMAHVVSSHQKFFCANNENFCKQHIDKFYSIRDVDKCGSQIDRYIPSKWMTSNSVLRSWTDTNHWMTQLDCVWQSYNAFCLNRRPSHFWGQFFHADGQWWWTTLREIRPIFLVDYDRQ